MDLARILQAYYLTASTIVLSVWALPFLRARLLPYGSRSEGTAESGRSAAYAGNTASDDTSKTKSSFSAMLDRIAAIQVPHSWFNHFYQVSVISSVIWAYVLAHNGTVRRFMFSRVSPSSLQAPSMTIEQVWLLWLLLCIQGSRRLLETYLFAKPSKSTMHITHWLVGVTFYLVDGMAIWVEGVPSLMAGRGTTVSGISSTLNAETCFCLLTFTAASFVQNRAHAHLASLKTYQMPPSPIFRYVLCPHYSAEIVIYIALALLAAPERQLVNTTMMTALVFVTVNLCVTADGTKAWYIKRFGQVKVGSRTRVIPGIW
jgi:3-oxo-5-alpha-steroid 4-dehydrogenase 3